MGQRCRGCMDLGTHIWHPLQVFLQGQMTSQKRESLGSRSSNALHNLLLLLALIYSSFNGILQTHNVTFFVTLSCLGTILSDNFLCQVRIHVQYTQTESNCSKVDKLTRFGLCDDESTRIDRIVLKKSRSKRKNTT